MKKIVLFSFFLLALQGMRLSAQEVKVTWSDRQMYSNKADGFFDYFVGGNSKYMYAMYHNSSRRNAGMPRLVSFNKETMAKVTAVKLIDLKNDTKGIYGSLEYYKTIIFDDVIYVFWTNDIRNKKELYVESFDAELFPQNPLKKVYELKYDSKNKKKPDFFVLYNSKIKEHLVIGGELAGNKQQNVKIEYKLLNKDFSFASSNQVELPIVTIAKSRGLTSSYEFGEDGNIHITSFVTLDKEQRKGMKKGEAYRFPVLSLVDPCSGKIKSHTLKFDNKNVFKSGYTIDKGVTKVYAFFCDLEKDPSGQATHGILYGTLNNQTLDIDNVNFSYFTKAQLDKLYANDKEDRKKVKTFKSKKKQDSDAESILEDYVVEDTESSGEDLVLFCSRMRNYSVTTCDSKGRCHTNYYCEKRNATVFRLSKDGHLVWASNLDRKITYDGWDINDVNAIHSTDKFFVTYGSAYLKDSEKKNRRAKKSRSYMSDRFEYAIFDKETGAYTKKEYKVNPANVKKADRKTIDPREITVIDNVFYMSSIHSNNVIWPVVAGLGLETVGLYLIISDILLNAAQQDLTDGGATYTPSHTRLYVGIGFVGAGIFTGSVVRHYLIKANGYVGKIEGGSSK